jgi:CO/xanthine dehydrogenase Mo-binding subunit/aerobic-type carbon monoxide dehydrogenase small subunit (CoxS/CutS family)
MIRLTVNGSPAAVDTDPMRRLSDVLREDLGLTGTKVGCEAGDCGACSVLIDGRLVNACTVPVGRLDGVAVTTVEGLSDGDDLTPLQRSFLHHGAAQCGICTPGMLVAATALLDTNPHPTESEVETALGGVLCRCTGYRKIIDAVVAATDFENDEHDPPPGKAVGRRVPRVDGVVKVSGTDEFGDDGAPDDALVIRVIRSPHHRASFAFGDLATYADVTPGVVAVFTADDVPGRNRFGVIPPFADQPVFAVGETRFRGEAVAMVVGEPGGMADIDLADFPITWTELDPLLDPEAALGAGAPIIHEERPDNVVVRGLVQRGDLDTGLADSVLVVEQTYSTPFIEHAYIEPEAGHAVRIGDRVEISVTTQSPHMDRTEVAAILGLEPDAIVIHPTAVGGGFGSKLDLSVQPYLAIAAWHLDRPVRITYTRPESMMSTTKRHPSRITVRVGADAAGRLTAMDFDGTFDTGAYASWGPTVANRAPVHAGGPYVYPAYRATTRAVHTHQPPSGAFRGFGVPQSAVAQESAFDELADGLGIDRLEFRKRNALVAGQPTMTGQVFDTAVGFLECLEALEPHWTRALADAEAFNASHDSRRRGVGVAGMWYGCGNTGLPNPSTIRVGVSPGGRVVLYQGAVDIGQGSNTVMSQICADALGIDMSLIDLRGADTDTTPDAGKTSASRQTFISGNAAYLAGQELRARILGLAGASPEARIELGDSRIVIHDHGATEEINLGELEPDQFGLVVAAEGTFDPETTGLDENGQGAPYAIYGYGAQMSEIEVDLELGTVRVVRITAAHDVGRAVNPTLVEGQIQGGIAQGLGLALMEEYLPGRNENLHDYLIPTFGDVPEIVSILIESNDPLGPYGAKGVGEHTLVATAPSILNAIRHATGVAIRDTPASPSRVLAAISSG